MSLLAHETKHCPLMLAIAKGKPTMEQHLESLTHWDNWFADEKPIHVIRFFDDADSLHPPSGAGKETKKWMNEGADNKFRAFIKHMMIVVPEDQYERMKNMSVTKVFGIPGGIFPSTDDAFEWLAQQADTDIFDHDDAWRNDIKETIRAHLVEELPK
ncbi:hypothetical protein [Marinomonas posidonica]|uniref:Uncharacterized protein n=1 Tax=Marinomonas posidonica (strain CECT 7376 / NCIMB 14433 / IVIA-Po-181) TaxID=491952 RepID=F6CXF4_MARPP|nr:hypothetical protein [Marinomonas posidonica]AEF55570.1 hypothetical protein Mar181_2539 [Marinomonas posidonica IVIA-Po-181]